MAQGKVTVNNLNLAQGEFPKIERKALFIGQGEENLNTLITLNSQTNLDEVLGAEQSEIKTQVQAAQLNAGENWQAYAMAKGSEYEWEDVVDEALQTVSVEFIVLCTPAQNATAVNAMYAKAESLRTGQARRVIILTATQGIGEQAWGAYITEQANIVEGVAGYRVAVVPQLHGNNLGALAGRLCNRSLSIADSPMRVASGPVLGLGTRPVDSAGVPLNNSMLAALDAARLSCPQEYADYPGIFWGDCNLLDAPGGDYQVIEHLRPVDKAARAIRLLAIYRVGNRSLNSTPVSIEANKTYFARPLREMSKSTVVAGEHFPGDIKQPKDDAVTIVWPTPTRVEVYLKVQPYNAPKQIEANIILDLNGS